MPFLRLSAGAALASLVLACAAPIPVAAKPLPKGGVTGPDVVAVLQDGGSPAKLRKDSGGDPAIDTAIGGEDVTVYFFGCEKDRCASLQFYSSFPSGKGLTAAKMNEWNANHRFGRAYLSDKGNPRLEMDMDVDDGSSTEAIAAGLRRWTGTLGDFKGFLK